MTARRLTALLLAAVTLAPVTPASAGEWLDTTCVYVAGFKLCTPPLPI